MTKVIDKALEGRVFHACDNYLALRLVEPQKQTAGGILLNPDSQTTVLGEVVHLGPGKWHTHGALVPIDANIGDIVQFGEWVNTETLQEIGGEKLLVIRETDVIGRWVKTKRPVPTTSFVEKRRHDNYG